MTMLPDRRRQQAFQAKQQQEHSYFGQHNTWYGEPMHECSCGFESHEKAEVLEHIAEKKEE